MSWCWFAMLPEPVQRSLASAPAWDLEDQPAGVLAAWAKGRKPVPHAVRMHDGLVDPCGPAAWVSLVLVPAELSPLFDDTAVSGALRAVLAGRPTHC